MLFCTTFSVSIDRSVFLLSLLLNIQASSRCSRTRSLVDDEAFFFSWAEWRYRQYPPPSSHQTRKPNGHPGPRRGSRPEAQLWRRTTTFRSFEAYILYHLRKGILLIFILVVARPLFLQTHLLHSSLFLPRESRCEHNRSTDCFPPSIMLPVSPILIQKAIIGTSGAFSCCFGLGWQSWYSRRC